MQTPRRKDVELAVIERVAQARGGTVLPSDTDPPDGYLVIRGQAEPIPVEVVSTYPWPHGAIPEPRYGAPAARAEAKVERQECALLAAGHTGVISHIHDAREAIVAPAGSMPRLPLPFAPLNPLCDVSLAIRTKAQKPYVPGTILVVDYHDGFPLEPDELCALGEYVRDVAPVFREVWICPALATYAQRASCDEA